MREWTKKLPSQNIDAVSCGSLILDGPQVMATEKAVEEMEVQVRGGCVCVCVCVCVQCIFFH